MDDDSGFKGCISLAGSLVGLVAGLTTIIGFFYSDTDSFFSAAEQFWSTTILGDLMPNVSTLLANISDSAGQFAQSSSLTPWWTALLVLVVGGIMKYFIEWWLLLDVGLREVLILTLPVVVWIWVFSGTVSIVWIIVFICGYLLSTYALSAVLEEFLE